MMSIDRSKSATRCRLNLQRLQSRRSSGHERTCMWDASYHQESSVKPCATYVDSPYIRRHLSTRLFLPCAIMKFLPNAITIGRIVVTPVLLVLLFMDTLVGTLGATVLFIVAAISDYFDGKLARHYGASSRLGRFLDPFADKVLVLGTFIALAVLIPAVVPWWAVILIAVRDLSVTGLRTWAESRGRSLRTLPMAKTKTALQLTFLIGVLVMLVGKRIQGIIGTVASWVLDSYIPMVLLIALVIVTVFTGIWYFVNQEYTAPPKVEEV